MNTKIGTTFGLALLMAIAVIATMFALGMFSTTEVRAEDVSGSVHVVDMKPSSSSVNAKAAWDVTFGVSGSGALIKGSGTITITFPKGVILPATIDKSRISVAGGGTADVATATFLLDPLTSDPTVSGQTVTITVPAQSASGDTPAEIGDDEVVKVFFSQLAGLVNPAKSGKAGSTGSANDAGKISTSSQTTAGKIPIAKTFNPTVSIDKVSAAEGDTIIVKVGGFTAGLKVTLSGAVKGSATVGSDGRAEIAATMKSTTGLVVTATDTNTTPVTKSTTATITLKPTLTATATGKRGDTITLTGKNFTAGSTQNNVAASTNIEFGSLALTAKQTTGISFAKTHTDRDADGDLDDFLLKITIPSNATTGVNQVRITDAGSATATATVTVESSKVTISPTSGPPGTVVTVTGAGFPAGRDADDLNKITISPDFDSDGNILADQTVVKQLFTDGTGSLPGSDQITIPASAKKTVITIKVTIVGADDQSATGTAKFTVGSRVLVLSPDSGPRGTKFLVSGTKFTPNATVTAGSVTVDSKLDTSHSEIVLTSAGDVPATTITVPKDAGIGAKTVSLSDGTLTGTATFTVTQPTVAASKSSATMGQTVTITGSGWVPASSVTVTLKSGTTTKGTAVVVAATDGTITADVTIPSTVGVGPKTVTFSATDTLGNSSTAVTLTIPKSSITLSAAEATVGDVITVVAAGFTPNSGLSKLEIGGADVRTGVSTSDDVGSLTVEFTVPGLTGSQLVTIKIGGTAEVSTSINVVKVKGTAAAATTAPAVIFADLIANDDNLVRVWRFSNATQTWEFYDPRPAFEHANTLEKSGAGDIVWVNVTSEQAFQNTTLFPGWNLISLD
ncbi:MAG: hypothetical protein IID01_12360 [Chloroflexi bacterium]|nr:hypothetical protein [Chloroflexota bacterium]